MKIWKVSNHHINGLCNDICEQLTVILNGYESLGADIKNIIETKPGDFRIIYTVEDDTE